MSSNGFRPFDDLSSEQYEEEWLFGLDDDQLKCGSPPPANVAADMGLSVPVRTCPSPLAQIPTREPYPSEPPPKLSPVPSEQQTFITLSNHVPAPSQQMMQPVSAPAPCPELAEIEYEMCAEMGILPVQPTSPVLIARPQVDVQITQPSTSGLQHNGGLVQQQPQQATCIQTVNGQWFVQTQVQHVQSGGTVIAVVPNFCRNQGPTNGQTVAAQSPQQLVTQPVANATIIAAQQSAQSVVQTQQQHQMQQHQQVLHPPKTANSLPLGVVTSAPQQGHSVMQHLLSQPAIVRQLPAATNTNVQAPQAKPKQRTLQPRANGRKKNVSQQGGTLGAVLAKANKLAAASSTDASFNQILPPSQGIEMRLSLESSEEVANLSKEISRLQNLQATYNVDHSAEIKDLEAKRAGIFFEALAQQHKDKDLLSAVNSQAAVTTPVVHTARQRNSNYHPPARQQAHHQVQAHHVQPSTSYEQQPMYEPNQVTHNTISYQNSYQVAQYPATSQALQRTSYDPRINSVQVQQSSASQYSYRTVPATSQACGGYVQEPQPAVAQPAVVIQQPVRPANVPVTVPPKKVQQTPAPLPPRLRTSSETAAIVSDKKRSRTSRLNDYFSSLRKTVEHADVISPFSSISDALYRLLPFHVYNEASLDNTALEQFDHNYVRHCVHLAERKNEVERRLRSLLLGETMKTTVERMDECVLLALDAEYERRALGEDRRAAASNLQKFVASSRICAQLKPDESKEKETSKTLSTKTQLHFEYHPFSEEEIRSRVISPLPESETEPEYSTEEEESTGEDLESVFSETPEGPKLEKKISEECSADIHVESSTLPVEKDSLQLQPEKNIEAGKSMGLFKWDQHMSPQHSPVVHERSAVSAPWEGQTNGSAFVSKVVCHENPGLPCFTVTGSFESAIKKEDPELALQRTLKPKRKHKDEETAQTGLIEISEPKERNDRLETNRFKEKLELCSESLIRKGGRLASVAEELTQNLGSADASRLVSIQQHAKMETIKREEDWVDSSPSPELAPASLCVVLPKVSLGIKNEDDEQTSEKNGAKRKLVSPVGAQCKADVNTKAKGWNVPDRAQISDRGEASGISADGPHRSDEKFINGVCRNATDVSLNVTHKLEENVIIRNDETSEVRPPIRIKIALIDNSLKHYDQEQDRSRKKEKKKKKKRKHRTEGHDRSHCHEAVASCSSEAGDESTQLVASTFDDPSHTRILMRISRRKNVVEAVEPNTLPASNCTSKPSSSENGRSEARSYTLTPPPKVPKLKIRLGGTRRSPDGGNQQQDVCSESAAVCSKEKKVPQQPISLSVCDPLSFLPKPSGTNTDTNLLFSSTSSVAQFSPESEVSDEEESMQLRAQTDNVVSHLSEWGSNTSIPGQAQAEAFSRLVGSAPLMNPLLSGLVNLPSTSWLLNANYNHTTGLSAAQQVPWLVPSSALIHHAATAAQHRTTTAFEESD